MKMKMVLAAAIIAVSASNAMAAAAKQINFLSLQTGFPVPTGCGLAITFSDAKVLPDDPESLAAAKPTGACLGQGVAIGAIGTATVAGETGNFLTLGQNVARERKEALMYVIQLSTKRKLQPGGIWAIFRTVTGRTVELVDGGIYQIVP